LNVQIFFFEFGESEHEWKNTDNRKASSVFQLNINEGMAIAIYAD